MNPLPFPEDVVYGVRYKLFKQTDLGLLYESIPFKKLAELFRDTERYPTCGRKPIFEIEGGLGLMFLKHYFQMSDKKLIQRLNADWQMQMFCGIQLGIAREIRDEDIVGRWRRFFGERLNIHKSQDVLVEYWDPYMENKHTLMNDATCYESYIKYPTDVKLLYDCSEWLFGQIDELCKKHKIKKPGLNIRIRSKSSLPTGFLGN